MMVMVLNDFLDRLVGLCNSNQCLMFRFELIEFSSGGEAALGNDIKTGASHKEKLLPSLEI